MPSERRALIIGINTYDMPDSNLEAAVADAEALAERLQRHTDGQMEPNYDCRVLLDVMEDGSRITRVALGEACEQLFAAFDGDVLLYFSGHGVLTNVGSYLCTTDATPREWGVSMMHVMNWACASRARNILVILDCCHAGAIGNPAALRQYQPEDPLALLRENMTVIAASRDSQSSVEAGGHGLFTAAVLDALDGGAADHMGWITAPSIYAYVERRFGAHDQRPIYKSHATRLDPVRKCAPLIERMKLLELIHYFPTESHRYVLDPEHEPEDEHGNMREPVNQAKVAVAQLFKDYRDAGLLRSTIPNEQFFWVARRSHTVELTTRGREYWSLAKSGRI